jgi:hypothetical protein
VKVRTSPVFGKKGAGSDRTDRKGTSSRPADEQKDLKKISPPIGEIKAVVGKQTWTSVKKFDGNIKEANHALDNICNST